MRSTPDGLADDLARIAARDIAAFTRVYQATSAKLFGVVVRILGRGDVANEILQEVYVRVWQRAVDYRRDQASPITWLVAIARNRALDERRRKHPSSLDAVPDYLDMPDDQDIEAEYLQLEDMRRLEECMEALSPDRRRLVEMIYSEGLTRDAAARRLDTTPAAVRSSLRASLLNLKGCLGDD